MTEKKSKVETAIVPTTPYGAIPRFEFAFYQNPDNSKLWTATYSRDGVVVFKIEEVAHLMCAAQMERRMRLAIFE